MNRGYFGIGIYSPKFVGNVGTLWRAAYNFGANFIFTVGKRYQNQKSDTTKSWKHIPLFHFDTLEDMESMLINNAQLVCVEQTEKSRNLKSFCHPERSIYLLSSEDYGFPKNYLSNKICVSIDSKRCLNVATAGAIVMYDRINKQ